MVNEQANVKITLNSQGAQRELEELQGEMKRLIALKTKAEKEGDVKGWKKIDGELKKVNRQASKLVRENQDIEKTLKNINGASLNDLQKAKRQLTSQVNKLNRNTDEYVKKSKQLKAVKNEISGIYKETSATTSKFGKLKNLAGQLLPAFGFAAIISGAIALGKKIFNLAKQTLEYRKQIQQLTGESGQSLADLTAKVEASANTFKKDFKELAVANHNFAASMKISEDQANDLINKGFLAGADASDEFLDRLREYGPQFQAAGISAEQAIAIMTQEVQSGVYSDKGTDAIKEATLAIREMTPVTRAAIEGIGLSSAKLEADLRSGSISYFDAIQMISNKMAELPPQSTEIGAALADIFKGAGEDAGLDYIKMLGTVETNMDKLVEGAGETAEAQQKLIDANQRLSTSWSELLGTGTGTFTAIKASAKVLLADGLEGIVKYGRHVAALIITIGSYTVATKLATLWQKRHNTATLTSIVSQKLQALAFHAQFAAIALYNSAVALLTGRLKVAAIQFRAFAAAMYANPIGIVVGAIVAAGAALYLYSKRLSAAEKAQRTLNEVNLEAKKRIVEEKLEVERLIKVARDDSRLKEDRIEAIKELKKIAPGYLDDLSLETINTDKATEATQKYIKALEQKAKVQAAQEKLVEIEKELLELQHGEDAAPNFWQQAWNAAKTGGNAVAKAAADAETYTNNLAKRQEELNLKKEKLLGITEEQIELDKKSRQGSEDDAEGGDTTGSGEAASKLSDFLKANAEQQKEAARKYFSEAGEGAFEAFMAAIEKEQQAHDINIALGFENEEAEEENPALAYAMEQYKKTKEYQLALNQSMYENGLIGEQQYQDQLTEITRQAEQERYEIKAAKIEEASQLINMASNFVMTMMDMELAKAGDNEKKKEEIRKKYASLQFAVTASQIIVDTAAAIMKALAQLGPIAGPIAAGIIGATGAAQLAVANAERGSIEGKRSGGYTDRYTTDDEVVDYVHSNEFVANAKAVRNPSVKHVLDIIDLAQKNGTIATLNLPQVVTPGKQTGGYTGHRDAIDRGSPAGADFQSVPGNDPELKALLIATQEILIQVKNAKENPPALPIDKFERERNKYIKIQQTSGL